MSAAEYLPAAMTLRDGYEAVLAALTKAALVNVEVEATFALAARLIAETLAVEITMICELADTPDRLVVRAAEGWRTREDEEVIIAIEPHSLAARALMTDSVLVENFASARDATLEGIVSGAAIVLHGAATPLGLLCAYSKRTFKLEADALAFLQVTAGLLALTLERSKLTDARDRAREASRLKSAFIGNASHEIRTPLNIILGYSELIGDYLTENGDVSQSAYVDAVRRASQRLLSTVDEVLDYSCIDIDGFQPCPAAIEIASFLDDAMAAVAALTEARHLEFSCVAEAAVSVIHFDSRCLTGALAHLLKAAIRIVGRGRLATRLYREPGGVLCLSIAIDGVRMHTDYLAHPSPPPTHDAGKSARRLEGAALGLALARKYLELGGASLLVTDEQGRRTIFTIRFTQEHNDRNAAPPDPFPLSSNPWAARRARILLVEDDAETQNFMNTVLGGLYDMIAAASANAARQALANAAARPDLILMDLALEGGEDGLKLVRALRADWRWQSTPIVALTAYAAPEDRVRALGAGCDAHLAKPVARQALIATIARLTRASV